MSILTAAAKPESWTMQSLWSITTRIKEIGRPDLPPLSVFLDAGVVPRESREDNRNNLGEDLGRYLVVRPGDLVFNKLRTWQGGHGVSQFHGIVSPAYYVLRPAGNVESRFLHYLLRSAPYRAELTRISKWMPPSQFDMPWEMLRLLSILLPPFADQRRIADFLDAETSRIDMLAEQRTWQRATLDERERSFVTECLLPGSLAPPNVDRRWPWLPSEMPGRPLVRLGYVCRLQSGITVDSGRDLTGDVVTRPYLRVANVQAGYVDVDTLTEVTVPRLRANASTLRPGDVLMTEGGDLDKLGRGTVWHGQIPDCLHQNHVFALRPDRGRLDGDYLALMTQTLHGRCYFESTGTRTTNLASTSSSKILSFPVPLPALSVQHKLVMTVKSEIDLIARTRRAIDTQLNLLAERRRALITAAVTGQIDVSTASGRGIED